MPGWTTGDSVHNNIAYTPGHLDCPAPHLRTPRCRRSVPDSLRPLTRDPHGPGLPFDLSVPARRALRVPHRRLSRQGAGHRRAWRLIVGLSVARRSSVATGWRGPRPTIRPLSCTPGRSSPCSPSTSCRALRATTRWRTCRTARWTGSIISWPHAQLLALDVANTPLIVEHEYPKARLQDRERLQPILQGSIAFVRKIDEAAACMYALQHEVLPAQGIPVQGIGRQAYRS